MSEASQLVPFEPQQQIVSVADSALSIQQLVTQRKLIQSAMKEAMEEGQHYGKIPGCGEKPTLLQPGAQLLAHLFRLRPEYEIIESELAHGNKRYRVTCRLFFIGSLPEIKIAEGVGESSSMESKHRFRNAAAEVTETGEPLPKAYWGWRETDGIPAANKKLGEAFDGQNVGPKKINGAWMVVIYKGGSDEKVENPNPCDVFNTVLKIAKKRAFVDATITATASSDFFTQDLEDIRENLAAIETTATVAPGTSANSPKTAPEKPKAAKSRKPKPGDPPPPVDGKGDDIPMFNGDNHKRLAADLAWNDISPERFMEVARSKKWIPENKMSFGQMPDEMAKGFLDDWDDVLEAFV